MLRYSNERPPYDIICNNRTSRILVYLCKAVCVCPCKDKLSLVRECVGIVAVSYLPSSAHEAVRAQVGLIVASYMYILPRRSKTGIVLYCIV